MTTQERFNLAKIAFEIHSQCSTIEDTVLTIREGCQLEQLYPCLRKKRFERLQQVSMETGAMFFLDEEDYCVNCGVAAPHFHMIENQLHCDDCRAFAQANHIVHRGLDAIIEKLVAEIPKSEWDQLAWDITVGFGGEPVPNGINWDCRVIE